MNEIDIRRGSTSASNAQADLLCPGRHNAQKGIPEKPAGPDAEFGRAIHAALAVEESDSANTLTTEQHDIFESCREVEKATITRFFGEDPTPRKIFREQRFWCKVKSGETTLEHSGQPDLVVRAGPKALILEYKSLPGDVPGSPANLQLRDQAVLSAGHLILNLVGVAVIQPLVTRTPEITLYNQEALKRAEGEMFARIRASNAQDAPRAAGTVQCQYCRAKDSCPAYAAWASRLMPVTVDLPESPIDVWTPDQLALFCEREAGCRKWLEDCKEAIKAKLTADPNSVPGWCLEPGQFREKVTDPQGLFDRFVGGGGTTEQFMACVEIAKGKFEEQLRRVHDIKGKALKAKLKESLEGLVESKQTAPSLARRKS